MNLCVYNCFVLQLGITNDTAVVLYDNNEDAGMYSVARAWLLFKVGKCLLNIKMCLE